MKSDTRTEMALTFILSEGKGAAESLSMLSKICREWKMKPYESFPIAMELINRMGVSRLDAIQALGGAIDMQDSYMERRN